ncbi:MULTISPECIES: hypothetical protein [Microbacterium]|uniref:Dioxygenase n=1 Tax=Microbacterium profundi TaxID=450380 RepID=A0ABV3LD62_9MICO|nr:MULTISPECIES: hypothetical protein [Microbacterium]MCE7480737.1 hypothetical protein [Microbacterium profundi]
MAGRGPKNAQRSRTESERARLYAARTAWHDAQIRRRTRDNLIAGIVGGLLVVGAIASQSVHAAVFAPEPEPTETSTPGPIENPFSGLFADTAAQ